MVIFGNGDDDCKNDAGGTKAWHEANSKSNEDPPNFIVDMPAFYSYTPSFHEYMMVLGTLGFFGAAYILGEIAFNYAAQE